MDLGHANLTIAVALAVGVLVQCLAKSFKIPAIVLLLAAGAVLGPDIAGIINPDALGSGLFGIVEFGVAVILFEGGLNLDFSRLRRQERSIRNLLTIGALLTVLGAAVAVKFLMGWSWMIAFLFGTLVVVTGPTVVTPLLREVRLYPKLRTILEAEGLLIDPIGAVLAVLALQVAIVPEASTFASESSALVLRLGFGLGAGVLGGVVMAFILRRRFLIPHGFENIFTLGCVVLLFELCELALSQSGLLAVTVAGAAVGNMKIPVDRDLREFKDQLTTLLIGLLFTLLAADVGLDEVRSLGWRGAVVVGVLVFLVRPVSVYFSTMSAKLNLRERAFIAWIAPRGIIAAAVASSAAAALDSRGIEGGAELRALVFLTIAGTVVLAGVTARPFAGLLKLRLPGRNRLAVLGANDLGFALATEFKSVDVPVVFFDSDPRRCGVAEEKGYQVVFGDALEERTLLRGQIELVGSAVGLTPNDHLNSMFVSNAGELFGVRNTCVAVQAFTKGKVPEYLERNRADVFSDGPHDVNRWDVRARHGDVETVRFVINEVDSEKEDADSEDACRRHLPPNTGEKYVVISVKRDKQVMPMTMHFEFRAGDIITVLIFTPELQVVTDAFIGCGWKNYRGEQHEEKQG